MEASFESYYFEIGETTFQTFGWTLRVFEADKDHRLNPMEVYEVIYIYMVMAYIFCIGLYEQNWHITTTAVRADNESYPLYM